MTPSELVGHSDITAIFLALGGEVRGSRGRAFWRSTDGGFNVSLNQKKGVWHDFARGEGGGVLDLISRALSCGRIDAARWLAQHHGVQLADCTPEDMIAARRRASDIEHAELWRAGLVRALERLKAASLEAAEQLHGEAHWEEWSTFAVAARDLYLAERLRGADLLAAFSAAPTSERQMLVADERRHRGQAVELAAAIVTALALLGEEAPGDVAT